MAVSTLLLGILVILFAAKLGAEIAERLHQPAVIGELVAGVLVGAGFLGPLSHHYTFLHSIVIDGQQPILSLIGQLGAVVLLFEVGLQSDIQDLRRLGIPALWVACSGVTMTFLMGYGAGVLLGMSSITSVFIGGALAATSVGITARTFTDLRQNHTTEARTVIGAAIADDVLGLIVLAVVTGMAGAKSVSALGVSKAVVVAIFFLGASLFLGLHMAPQILKIANRMQTRAALTSAAFGFCLVLAVLSDKLAGLSPIIGAFAAGLILAKSEHKLHIEQNLKPVADVLIPIFFVMMGASMPISALNPSSSSGRTALALAGILTLISIVSKVAAGLSTPVRKGLDRLTVGIGMIPRGEVALIFVAYGLKTGAVDASLYSAILIVVMATTFVTPPLLKLSIARSRRAEQRALVNPESLLTESANQLPASPLEVSVPEPMSLDRAGIAQPTATPHTILPPVVLKQQNGNFQERGIPLEV